MNIDLRRIVFAIAALTFISGLIQMLAPSFVLSLVGGAVNPTSSHLFAIIGMFMLLFGGLMVHGVCIHSHVVVFWAGLQKLGAAVAVYVGFQNGLFSWLALLIAAFDLCSALLYWYYMSKIRYWKESP